MQRSNGEPDRDNILNGYEKQSFDKVWALLRPYRSMLFGSMAALILFNMVGLTMPWMLKLAIDRILPNADFVLYWVVACV